MTFWKSLNQKKLVLDWRKKQEKRASVKLCIEEMLEKLPSVFTPEIYHQKCNLIYQHVYEAYYGSGSGIYAHQKKTVKILWYQCGNKSPDKNSNFDLTMPHP